MDPQLSRNLQMAPIIKKRPSPILSTSIDSFSLKTKISNSTESELYSSYYDSSDFSMSSNEENKELITDAFILYNQNEAAPVINTKNSNSILDALILLKKETIQIPKVELV